MRFARAGHRQPDLAQAENGHGQRLMEHLPPAMRSLALCLRRWTRLRRELREQQVDHSGFIPRFCDTFGLPHFWGRLWEALSVVSYFFVNLQPLWGGGLWEKPFLSYHRYVDSSSRGEQSLFSPGQRCSTKAAPGWGSLRCDAKGVTNSENKTTSRGRCAVDL